MGIVCILGDLNRLIGDMTRAGITVAFGVPRENDDGRRMEEFCAERGLCGASIEICLSTQDCQGVKM